MKNTKRPWFILFLLSIFATLVASAQVTVTNLQPEHITATDQQIADVVSKFSYWKTMIVPLTLILVAAIKKWVGFIPNKYLPWTGPIIGGLLDLLASKFGFWTGDVGAGAAMGGLATWAHQALFVQPSNDEGDEVPADGGNPTKLPLMLLIGALSFGTVAITTTGCSIFGKTPRTIEAQKFDTYKSVYSAARESYKTFKRECFAGKVTAGNEALGDKAWNEFRVAYTAAFKIGMDDVLAPENVVALKNQLVRLLLTF